MDDLFGADADRDAYEAYCAEAERAADEPFSLAEPALVCRWRMANKRVPLLNRHIRALSHRMVNGLPVSRNLLSWAKQHIEWSLAEGAYEDVDGVLMLVVDAEGNAAMTVGAYEPLADDTPAALAGRAAAARLERGRTGVAPELLCGVRDGALVIAADEDERLCAMGTLVEQLAQTRGMRSVRDPGWAASLLSGFDGESDPQPLSAACPPGMSEVFLISDEHGVVGRGDGARVSAPDPRGGPQPGPTSGSVHAFLRDGYARLMDSVR